MLNIDEYLVESDEPEPEQGQGGGRGGRGLGGGNRLPQDQFRFNWSSPLILSPHQSTTIYFGGNHVFKSINRGDTWTIVSPDLSYNDPEATDRESGGLTRDVTGAETHANVITIAESPIKPGLIWAGTDDGRVQVTRDDGAEWTDVRPNVPGVPDGLWVSRVVASRYAEGRAYVTFDGHRSDNFGSWVVRTDDYGATWTDISGNLPDEPVYVIVEDPKNADLLFVGTEFAVYGTVSGGESWGRTMNGMPTVPVHDLIIHPRDGDLIAATHGRSIWILDDITPLQQLNAEVLAADAHLFDNKVATQWRGISRGATRGHKLFMGRNPLTIDQRGPGNSPSELINSAAINFYLKDEPEGDVSIAISEVSGEQTFEATIDAAAGINRYFWPMRFSSAGGGDAGAGRGGAGGRGEGGARGGRGGRGGFRGPPGSEAAPGTYLVRLTVDGEIHTTTLSIRADPAVAGIQ
ncbi:MAG: exo-alpha-sialidase [Acidobacteria bacterium]|nr:exo-alpha-sialidase [Acidobacteriota bacterium]